jgi:hypothetical protein
MPRPRKRKNQAQHAVTHRWSSVKVSSSSESSNEEYSMDVDDKELSLHWDLFF